MNFTSLVFRFDVLACRVNLRLNHLPAYLFFAYLILHCNISPSLQGKQLKKNKNRLPLQMCVFKNFTKMLNLKGRLEISRPVLPVLDDLVQGCASK